MTEIEFEARIQTFWEKVQTLYAPYIAKGGILENRDYYVFQTKYKYRPELMIVGVNPGGNGMGHGGWLSQGMNSYTEGEHPWFQTLQNAFGFPNNKKLSNILESCVGSNKYFVNTGSEKDVPKEIRAMSTLLIRELVDIVCPKHILTLGVDVFCTIKNKPEIVQEFGSTKFKYSDRNGTPVGYLPNPSKMNHQYFTQQKTKEWNEALEWFLTGEQTY